MAYYSLFLAQQPKQPLPQTRLNPEFPFGHLIGLAVGTGSQHPGSLERQWDICLGFGRNNRVFSKTSFILIYYCSRSFLCRIIFLPYLEIPVSLTHS
jgi:hypothetical protein